MCFFFISIPKRDIWLLQQWPINRDDCCSLEYGRALLLRCGAKLTSPSACLQVFSRKAMDLHGLHVSEAVEVLETQMAALSKRGVVNVRVLTGTGHHSKGPTSKVRRRQCLLLLSP